MNIALAAPAVAIFVVIHYENMCACAACMTSMPTDLRLACARTRQVHAVSVSTRMQFHSAFAPKLRRIQTLRALANFDVSHQFEAIKRGVVKTPEPGSGFGLDA